MAPLKKSRIIEISDASGSDDDSGNDEGNPPSKNVDEVEVIEELAESAEEELKWLSKKWTSPIYVFFKLMPSIVYIKGRHVHVFECAATRCMGKGNVCMVCQYLDTGDAKSTGNLWKHAKICWGEEAVSAADNTKDVRASCEALGTSITAAFKQIAKDKVTYSHHQHTTTEARQVTSLPVSTIKKLSNQKLSIARKLFAGSQKISGHSKLLTIVVFNH